MQKPRFAAAAQLAHRLRDLRDQKGMSQDTLAKVSNVSRPSITAIERGGSNPRMETLDRLARALDIDVLELIANEALPRRPSDDRPSLERIARNVNRLRTALGVSQEALSQRSQHFRTYVGNLERYMVNPSLADVEAIASALEVAVETLLAWPDPSARNDSMQKLVRKSRRDV